jgi:hemolysin activation/secretion protein
VFSPSIFFELGVRLMLQLGLLAFLLASVAAMAESAGGPEARFFIREYQIKGARSLPRIDIESAVYPFLGPERSNRDIEDARAALEKAYADAGYQTVAVSVPPQNIASGVVQLRVLERTVGRLRVRGAKYSSPQKIKAVAPSVAEGSVINFNEVPKDILALNQLPDRQVTPSLRAGAEPGTVDVDLEVKEQSPIHASVELNNRNSPATEPLRLNASVSANNLAQSGHSLGFSFQTAPQDTSQVKVYSGYWLARFQGAEWLNLMLQGTKQDSNVSTLGGAATAGRGSTVGLRLLFNLPAVDTYTQSATVGLDYKKFDQTLELAPTSTSPATTIVTPITYYPLSADYTGTWPGKHSTTAFDAGVTFNVRGVGSDEEAFNNSRYNAGGSFIYFHGDISHSHDLGGGLQIFGQLEGQLADQPLLSGEQYAGGGLATARGYHEAEEVGDSGIFGTLELRSPALLKHLGSAKADWRVYAFADAGWLKAIDPLPGQKTHFDFASYGAGTRIKVSDWFSGHVVVSVPQLKEGETEADEVRVIFQGILSY